MAVISVRGPLRKLTGAPVHELDGETVITVLRNLELRHPGVAGWILDERGTIRPHINVYVNGEPAAEGTSVGDGDRVEVLPAITGGFR